MVCVLLMLMPLLTTDPERRTNKSTETISIAKLLLAEIAAPFLNETTSIQRVRAALL